MWAFQAEVDSIRRFGGSTSADMPWPEDEKLMTDDETWQSTSCSLHFLAPYFLHDPILAGDFTAESFCDFVFQARTA